MAKQKKQNKAEVLGAEVALAVGAGKAITLESVDFSDPNRPKTCIEVDFPIFPVNQVAVIEGNAGKPIYQMSKWWARRRSSVFRSMLIAAATKAPEDEALAAKTVWDAYYANHQKRAGFKDLRVADVFMGGGTTIVEGTRLGMRLLGNDLNPVAWFVVKGETAKCDLNSVGKLLSSIEDEVRPQIIPFYATECPRGHKGKWTHIPSGRIMDEDFDPLSMDDSERGSYKYDGPEVIYTFWAKHGACSGSECGHRSPVMSTHSVAVKEIAVKSWPGFSCNCGCTFTVEQDDVRMAPGTEFIVSPDEPPFAAMDKEGRFDCPSCGKSYEDYKAKVDGSSSRLAKSVNKKVSLSLFVQPQWMRGEGPKDSDGNPLGGSVEDSAEDTARWNEIRGSSLELVEVRGNVPNGISLRSGVVFDPEKGNIPKRSHFTCREATCGRDQDLLVSVKASGKTAPFAAYAEQCYCPQCHAEGQAYGGRYFDKPSVKRINAALREWERLKSGQLDAFWPKSEIPVGAEIGPHDVNGHHYSHWWKMFNGRQLLVLARLLRSILHSSDVEWETREMVMAAFQQYLRNQNLFCFWNPQGDKLEPHFSKSNFHPKSTAIENSVFPKYGRGNWASCIEGVVETAQWVANPWDLVANEGLVSKKPELAKLVSGKSEKAYLHDSPMPPECITCGSSTDLPHIETSSVDLVITDPPFGDLVQYSELSDFFYVWLRLALKDRYPEIFAGEFTPKTLEAVANKFREPGDPNGFYKRLLTQCWRESHRMLKPGGLLAFTFHHSEDEPWVAVLESLFDAGFYLEATYPIRSDETKGDGDFGSQKVEYDIIHVCRKRLEDPTPISWAKMRRKIGDDVRQLKGVLEQHRSGGLPKADLQVIRRGKALEYFSKHYGHVYIEKGRPFSLLEALAGIHQVLDDEDESSSSPPPVSAEPFTRQFLRIFDGTSSVDRDQIQKYLRGTGTSPALFVERGWCKEEKKVYHLTDPGDFAKGWRNRQRKGMSRDFDQTLFLVGACFRDSGIRVEDTLNNANFEPHPAIPDLLDWMSERGGTPEIRTASRTAKTLYSRWLGEHKAMADAATAQFDLPLEF